MALEPYKDKCWQSTKQVTERPPTFTKQMQYNANGNYMRRPPYTTVH